MCGVLRDGVYIFYTGVRRRRFFSNVEKELCERFICIVIVYFLDVCGVDGYV